MQTALVMEALMLLAALTGASAKCLCCRGEAETADEGFCKWWSAKHAKVESLGLDAAGNGTTEEAKRLYIAYFRTHARLEDPLMWDLFRECSAFNATRHEPLLQANEHEENEIREGLQALAAKVQGGSGTVSVTWEDVQAKVAAHITSEEQLLKGSGLLELCESHLDRRWSEIMEKTHEDARILYEEFRHMDLDLVQILRFVRGMVADWPAFPELRQRTALRMRQVRHRMPEMLASSVGNDLLQQVNTAVVGEYIQWVQLERTEGLKLDLGEEIFLHLQLLASLRLHPAHTTIAQLMIAAGIVIGLWCLRIPVVVARVRTTKLKTC